MPIHTPHTPLGMDMDIASISRDGRGHIRRLTRLDVTTKRPRAKCPASRRCKEEDGMPRRVTLIVSFDLPEGATVAAAVGYVEDAVASHAGSLRPPGSYGETDEGDPFFGLDRDSVRVRSG
jgi:hypothetical protein